MSAGDPTPGPAVTLRPPAGPEVRACRMLLPEVFRRGEPAEFLLAVESPPLRILAAAAWSPTSWDGRPHWQADVHVVPPARRRGVGSALLAAVADQARLHGVAGLMAWHDSATGPDAGSFLAARGFTVRDRLTVYEVPIDGVNRYLRPLRDWLVEGGWVPADARLVPLAEAPPDAVARLHADGVGGNPGTLAAALAAAIARRERFTTHQSRVLLVAGEVKGLFLVRSEGDLARIESKVVDPAYRGGSANVLLMTADLDRALAAGVRRVQFYSSSSVRDTAKMAGRCGGRAVGFRDVYVRPILPAES